jgi:hypothetical protein
MADRVSDLSSSVGIISALEKAHETRTSLLLFAFVMFLDTAMVVSGGSGGLYDFYADSTALSVNLVLDVTLIFVFFSLFMSMPMAMPLIAELVRQILILCFHSIVFHITYNEDHVRSMWRAGYVQPYRISREAHSTRDQYFLDSEKEATAKEREASDRNVRLNFLTISCLVLSAFNLFYDRASHATLLQHIERAIPHNGLLWMLVLLMMFLAFAVWLTVGNHDVYACCPSLAREYVEDLEKNLAEGRRLRELADQARFSKEGGDFRPPDLP